MGPKLELRATTLLYPALRASFPSGGTSVLRRAPAQSNALLLLFQILSDFEHRAPHVCFAPGAADCVAGVARRPLRRGPLPCKENNPRCRVGCDRHKAQAHAARTGLPPDHRSRRVLWELSCVHPCPGRGEFWEKSLAGVQGGCFKKHLKDLISCLPL